MEENHVNGDFEEEEDEEFAECGRFSLLDSLARRDEGGRTLVLDRLERAFARWRGKMAAAQQEQQQQQQQQEEEEEEEVREARKLLEDHLWTALALRWNAPFADIRQRMNALLEEAKLHKIPVPQPLFSGPTSFIPREEVSLQQREFLANGGDQAWVDGGIQSLPPRLLNLLTLNKLLAHQPWLVTPEHMKSLLTGTESWSVSELAHALVVMAHFHSLSSLTLSCGLTLEIDTHRECMNTEWAEFGCLTNPALGLGRRRENSDSEPSQTDSEPLSPDTSSPPPSTDSRTGQYMVQYFLNSTSEEGTLGDSLMAKLRMMDTATEDEETEQQRDSQFVGAASIISTDEGVHKPKSPVPIPFQLAQYIDDPSFQHEDFNGSSAGTLRARDYSWEDHGYAFLSSLYPDICPLLDGCFSTSFSMTYNFVGKEKNVDTTNFREAIWYYIHSIKGIRHDDYQYRKVNQVLDISFKTFIRMVGCFPEKVSSVSFQGSMAGLEPSEKVHVNIIVVDARTQAELIYAMRALMRFMKSK